jgi:ABC-2 type transport system ATP-binding protein
MSAIELHHVRKSYGPVRAVDDLSFTVQSGTVTAFLGPNGAGKTTTLRVLLGLVAPDGGAATIGGRRYADLPSPLTAVGAVLEGAAFHPGRSARIHLRALCLAAGLPGSRVAQVLDEVDLTAAADRRVGGFSLGMRQRLALASAMVGDPDVLVLDEPANGLDPTGIHWLRGFLRAKAADGRTVLVASHVLAEMEHTADRVVIVDRGRLAAEGAVADLSAGRSGLEAAYLELVGGIR